MYKIYNNLFFPVLGNSKDRCKYPFSLGHCATVNIAAYALPLHTKAKLNKKYRCLYFHNLCKLYSSKMSIYNI